MRNRDNNSRQVGKRRGVTIYFPCPMTFAAAEKAKGIVGLLIKFAKVLMKKVISELTPVLYKRNPSQTRSHRNRSRSARVS